MRVVKIKNRKKYDVKVVLEPEKADYISVNDAEMDARAAQAVKVAIEKAEFCKKPVAKYDIKTKRAYIEFPDGVRKYVH